MSAPLNTLLETIRNGQDFISGARVLFLNAQFDPALNALDVREIICLQDFRPYAHILEDQGHCTAHQDGVLSDSFDVAFLLLPKNMIEARFMIARAVNSLRQGGALFCSADNKAGGTRIAKLMDEFGFGDIVSTSGNKSRCVVGIMNTARPDVAQKALYEGRAQPIEEARFISQPGIFGWNKIDKGSAVLTEFLPTDLRGGGADFGCGYGYLSDFILSHCTGIQHLNCVDADKRAVDVCRQNLDKYTCTKEFLWRDLTKPQSDLNNLDFVVMNPPFHEGKKQDIGIGLDFIDVAYQSLKKRGDLWMVANAHLPYEPLLGKRFFNVKKYYEGRGFKVFQATK